VHTTYAAPVVVSTATPPTFVYVQPVTVTCCCDSITVGGFAFAVPGKNDRMVVYQ
jgi:hypothetical protein